MGRRESEIFVVVQVARVADGSESRMEIPSCIRGLSERVRILRTRVFGCTRAEIREQAARELAELQSVIAGQAGRIEILREQHRVARQELLEATEDIRKTRDACQSKDSALFDFRARVTSLESDNRDLRRQLVDKVAESSFHGFLSTELQQQVAIQRDMIARHKVIDEIVDCIKAGDRPGEAVRKRALGIGEAGGAVAADPVPLDKRARSSQAKGGRRRGADRKPRKGGKA